ncbi:hypothetical protein ACTWP8_27555 [Streptomyces sp. 7N604]
MASHARSKSPMAAHAQGVQAALLRAGFIAAAAGAVLGASGAATASALPVPGGEKTAALLAQGGGKLLADPNGSLRGANKGVGPAVAGVAGPAKSLPVNPLSNTGADPLNNAVGTQVADFKPVSTKSVTGQLTDGQSLDDLPVTGPVARKLPGGWDSQRETAGATDTR